MPRRLIYIVGIPLVTFSLFVFECSDPTYYLAELIWSFVISVILWVGNGLIIEALNRYIPWRREAGPRLLIQIGSSVLFTVWVTYFGVGYLQSDLYEAHFSSLVFRKNLFVFLIISLLYNALYTGSHFFSKWRLSIVEAEELKRENLQFQYDLLKNQINPHFLFNSVNTLIGLIDEDPELAKTYGTQFADIYRQILVKGKEELITVRDELDIVHTQKQLFHARFGDGLRFQLEIPASQLSKMLPPLTLQMLIENAIKHNTISRKMPLTIDISVDGDYLVVSNNVRRKNYVESSTGTGIQNIRKRYALLTDREIIIKEDEFHFVVMIPLLEGREK